MKTDETGGKKLKEETTDEMIKEESLGKEEKKPDHEKITKIIIFIMVGILSIFLTMLIVNQLSQKSEYSGIEFKKNYVGKILFYTAQVPMFSQGKITGYIALDFRNNPGDLADVPVSTQGDLKFIPEDIVYVSVQDPIKICEDNGIAMANLGRFISNSGLKVKGAIDNQSYENSSITYANCEKYPDNTVIMIKDGNETKIEQTAANCYAIVFKDCEILRATEKFELVVLEQHMKRNGYSG